MVAHGGSEIFSSRICMDFSCRKKYCKNWSGCWKTRIASRPYRAIKRVDDSKIGPISKLGKITPIEFHYGLIPNDGLSRKTVYNNLILVGDSAGQANPLVLEGIRYAIKFGRVAGKIVANAIKSGKTDEAALYPYEEK